MGIFHECPRVSNVTDVSCRVSCNWTEQCLPAVAWRGNNSGPCKLFQEKANNRTGKIRTLLALNQITSVALKVFYDKVIITWIWYLKIKKVSLLDICNTGIQFKNITLLVIPLRKPSRLLASSNRINRAPKRTWYIMSIFILCPSIQFLVFLCSIHEPVNQNGSQCIHIWQ